MSSPPDPEDASALPIRILIVDDHPVLRGVVRMACDAAPGMQVVAEAGDGTSALDECARVRPDVVVLDLELPGMDGLEVARRLQEAAHAPRILALSERSDDRALFECMRIGVGGFLGKSAGMRQITGAIEVVAAGGRVFTPEQEATAHDVLRRHARRAQHASKIDVSPRELEVLRLIADGLTMRQVATRLGISPRTVESHIANLYRKLGAGGRVQAIARAAALGLIELD